MVDPIAGQVAIRDRFRRKLSRLVPFDERVRQLMGTEKTEGQSVQQTPDGRAHFLRRNFRLRAMGGPQERSHRGS